VKQEGFKTIQWLMGFWFLCFIFFFFGFYDSNQIPFDNESSCYSSTKQFEHLWTALKVCLITFWSKLFK